MSNRGIAMRTTRTFALFGLAMLALTGQRWTATIAGQSPQDTVEAHCAAAKAAAGTEQINLYNRFADVCDPSRAATPARGGRGVSGAAPPPVPDRSVWHHDPVKVFDNLYFVGTKEHSSWVVQT